jgi:hypothetical protein
VSEQVTRDSDLHAFCLKFYPLRWNALRQLSFGIYDTVNRQISLRSTLNVARYGSDVRVGYPHADRDV